jgi:hypothetical protein
MPDKRDMHKAKSKRNRRQPTTPEPARAANVATPAAASPGAAPAGMLATQAADTEVQTSSVNAGPTAPPRGKRNKSRR